MKRVAVVGIMVVMAAVATVWSQSNADFGIAIVGVKSRVVGRFKPYDVMYYTDVKVLTNENPGTYINHKKTTHLWVKDVSTGTEVCHGETTFHGRYQGGVYLLRFQVTYPASVNTADKVRYKFQSRIMSGDQNESNDLHYLEIEYPRGGTPACKKLK